MTVERGIDNEYANLANQFASITTHTKEYLDGDIVSRTLDSYIKKPVQSAWIGFVGFGLLNPSMPLSHAPLSRSVEGWWLQIIPLAPSSKWLAYATQSQERYADAEVLFRELMTSQESTLGKKAYGTLNRTVQDCRTNFGMETPDTVDSLYWCALCKFQLKRYSEAEALLTESLAGYRKLSGDRQYDILVRSDNLQPGAVHRIGGIVEGSDICVSKRRWRSTHRYHKPAVLEWSLIFRSTSVRRGRSTVQAGL